jgi:MFS family permease
MLDEKVAGSGDEDLQLNQITPGMDRENGSIFLMIYLLTYLAAPVIYVGVIQAALCDKLGASATVANLPGAVYFLGNFTPIFVSSLVPLRLERSMIVWVNLTTAILLAIVGSTLLLPLPRSVCIAALIVQGLVQGFTASTSQVFLYQCMGRGTTLEGRARAFKLAFSLGPIAAVIGSLGAHFVLSQGIPALTYPYDFALLYFIGVPCMLGVALVCGRLKLLPVREGPRLPVLATLSNGVRTFVRDRSCLYLWLAYALWYSTLSAMPNLSLFSKEAVGRDPKDLSGLVMALRFGFKSLGGYLLAVITIRWGVRVPLLVTLGLLGTATLWGWVVPGYSYLLAFGLMGAGELGGAYFPNYMVAVSPLACGARNQALLSAATLFAGLSATLHGALTDGYGFQASFAFGVATALLGFWLVFKLPARPKVTNPEADST